ncbi:MAG: gamma-glutamyl-gamma-aminobutyrate hydrolase [Rhodospirillaceae bacterium TMED167]|nr:gamma-glutamyl-gamma-aminobutyrate hydrolase [Rhodospirillaceae bacterium]OUW23812.1 MAG: gamma-glutamyl-gamma-aminobutyrate hydrolase [Rhodospirillaceae bacterium TMED167]
MAAPGQRPLIAITVDSEDPGGYSKFPWYALRENYAGVVVKAGGMPLILPNESALVDDYAALVDGLIITGGAFDVSPALYGEGTAHDTVILKENRTAFELGITRKALERDIPVLGICGGEQLLNVALGGTLIQHIPDDVNDALAHEQPNPRDEPGHPIVIEKNTLLHDIVGVTEMRVNSAHHQAVAAVSGSITVNATAPDGVIEGIEAPRQRFCLGVQWHPEFEVDPNDMRIFSAFIDAARN